MQQTSGSTLYLWQFFDKFPNQYNNFERALNATGDVNFSGFWVSV
jgi:hypothetical protein